MSQEVCSLYVACDVRVMYNFKGKSERQKERERRRYKERRWKPWRLNQRTADQPEEDTRIENKTLQINTTIHCLAEEHVLIASATRLN